MRTFLVRHESDRGTEERLSTGKSEMRLELFYKDGMGTFRKVVLLLETGDQRTLFGFVSNGLQGEMFSIVGEETQKLPTRS